MDNLIILFVIIAIVTLAMTYIIRAKKKGQKCVGCPSASTCCKNCCKQ